MNIFLENIHQNYLNTYASSLKLYC